jgi:hypothetical protein
MRAAHAMAIYGGVVGWIVGVGEGRPMLVPRWRGSHRPGWPRRLSARVVLAGGPRRLARATRPSSGRGDAALGMIAVVASERRCLPARPGRPPLLARGGTRRDSSDGDAQAVVAAVDR